MFGITKSSKSTAIVLSAALAMSAGLATAASASAPVRAGNSFEVPLAAGGGCQAGNTYGLRMPEGNVVPMACSGTTHESSMAFYSGRSARGEAHVAPAVAAASTNPMMTCVGGYTWRYKVAGEWDTLPIRCH